MIRMYQEIFRKKSIFNGLKIIKGGKVFRIDGKRYLVTASVIPTLDWLMIGLTPVNELTKAGKAMTQIIYVVGIIAALISTFFSLRVSHSVTKPLIYLTDTMKKFGKGDLSVRVPVLYEDEIGILSEEFNKMSEQIRQLVDQVYREQRAKENLSLQHFRHRLIHISYIIH